MWRLWPWVFFIHVLGIFQSRDQEATQDATQQADTQVLPVTVHRAPQEGTQD